MPLITASVVQAAGPLMKTKAVKHNHFFLLNICVNKTALVPSYRWRSPETIHPEHRTPSPHSPSCHQALDCYYTLNEWTKQMKCFDPNKLISSSGIAMKVVHHILIQTSCCFGCKWEQHAADVGKKETTIEAVGWLCARYPGNDGWGQKSWFSPPIPRFRIQRTVCVSY